MVRSLGVRILRVNTVLTIANSFLLNIAEHENFSANKYENAKMSMKKSFITQGPDVAVHVCSFY